MELKESERRKIEELIPLMDQEHWKNLEKKVMVKFLRWKERKDKIREEDLKSIGI